MLAPLKPHDNGPYGKFRGYANAGTDNMACTDHIHTTPILGASPRQVGSWFEDVGWKRGRFVCHLHRVESAAVHGVKAEKQASTAKIPAAD